MLRKTQEKEVECIGSAAILEHLRVKMEYSEPSFIAKVTFRKEPAVDEIHEVVSFPSIHFPIGLSSQGHAAGRRQGTP